MELSEFRINERFISDVVFFAGHDQEVLDAARQSIDSMKPSLLWQNGTWDLVPDRCPHGDRIRLGQFLRSLGLLVANYAPGPAKFLESVRNQLLQLDQDQLDSKLRDRFLFFLEWLTSSKNFLLSAKATTLSAEFQNAYIESRIVTDIRPIFNPFDCSDGIDGTILLHHLKFVYSGGSSGDKEIFLSLTEYDLECLAKDIDRARSKASAIKPLLLVEKFGQMVQDV